MKTVYINEMIISSFILFHSYEVYSSYHLYVMNKMNLSYYKHLGELIPVYEKNYLHISLRGILHK